MKKTAGGIQPSESVPRATQLRGETGAFQRQPAGDEEDSWRVPAVDKVQQAMEPRGSNWGFPAAADEGNSWRVPAVVCPASDGALRSNCMGLSSGRRRNSWRVPAVVCPASHGAMRSNWSYPAVDQKGMMRGDPGKAMSTHTEMSSHTSSGAHQLNSQIPQTGRCFAVHLATPSIIPIEVTPAKLN